MSCTISESLVLIEFVATLIPVPAPTAKVTPPELALPLKPEPPVTDVIVPALLVKGKSLTAFIWTSLLFDESKNIILSSVAMLSDMVESALKAISTLLELIAKLS